MPKRTGSQPGKGTAIGIAALAAAAAAGAYYFYAGKDAVKRRKALRGWAVKVKGEIIDKLEDMQHVTKETYDRVVTDAIAKYKKVKKVSPKELAALEKELRRHWKAISK